MTGIAERMQWRAGDFYVVPRSSESPDWRLEHIDQYPKWQRACIRQDAKAAIAELERREAGR